MIDKKNKIIDFFIEDNFREVRAGLTYDEFDKMIKEIKEMRK